MRKTGKRLLAGLASGALALTGVAFVAAPQAQAADEPIVYCSGGSATGAVGGEAGVPGDPTSVSTGCLTPGGPAVTVDLNISNLFGTADDSPVLASAVGFVNLTTSAGSFDATGHDDTIALNSTNTSGWFSGPGAASTAIGVATPVKLLVGSTPQTITVTVATSSAKTLDAVTTLNTTQRASIEIIVTGAPGSMVISPAYKVKANTDDSAAIGLLQVFGADGNVIPVGASNVTLGQIGSSVVARDAVSGDCVRNARGVPVFSMDDSINGGGLTVATEACAALVAGGSGVWLVSTGAQDTGSYTVTAVVSVGGATFTETITYQVSGQSAAGATVAFDKEQYVPGETAALTWCLTDLAGNPVADGLGWSATGGTGDDTRTVNWVSNAVTAPVNFNGAGVPVATYGGCLTVATFAPATPMTWDVVTSVPAAAQNGWAAAARGAVLPASALVGSAPDPDVATITITGTRGTGSDSRSVFVEGNTTGLVGQAVTPFFRLPGQIGFTAGVGVRTVDAQGNFNWQRKTGKRIAVQFRAGDVRSDTIIIPAR